MDDERLKQGERVFNYDNNSEIAKVLYSMVQNKFHYAITGKTAPEIIKTSADKGKTNMGLTTWKNSPDGRILKSDVTIAKNYLSMTEIKRLERSMMNLTRLENLFLTLMKA